HHVLLATSVAPHLLAGLLLSTTTSPRSKILRLQGIQFPDWNDYQLSNKESSSRSCRSSTNTPKTPTMKNSSQRRRSFSRKCARLVKEQRARFYIIRRCVTMLICWRDYTDS
ncbi:Small polypeptide DEVIL 8, partial [Linum grandiflorum]